MTSSAPRASTYQLPVPDAALAEFARTQGLPDPGTAEWRAKGAGPRVAWDLVEAEVRAISAPVVAAVLREEVARIGDGGASYRAVERIVQRLTALADEIDGSAS